MAKFTLTAHPSTAPLTVIRLGLIIGSVMIAGLAFFFPMFVEDIPFVQNILFVVAATDLALAFIVPKILEKHFKPVEVRFYSDRLEFGETGSLPYASIRDVQEEQSEAQKARGVTNIVISAHGQVPALTSYGQKHLNRRRLTQQQYQLPNPPPDRSDLLSLPDVAVEGDPALKIKGVIDEYRSKIR